jgi:hypothetical protein
LVTYALPSINAKAFARLDQLLEKLSHMQHQYHCSISNISLNQFQISGIQTDLSCQ